MRELLWDQIAQYPSKCLAAPQTCTTFLRLTLVQIDGTRNGAPSTKGGGNIEFGNSNTNQLIEYVKSFDPRGWTCLHVAEGPLKCQTVTIQNNDIGPCGSDAFQEWADGISISCRNSVVRNNMIQGATDGGIVIFGSPGTQVFNNTIWVLNVSFPLSCSEFLTNGRCSKLYLVVSIWWTMTLGAEITPESLSGTMLSWAGLLLTMTTRPCQKEAILRMLSSSIQVHYSRLYDFIHLFFIQDWNCCRTSYMVWG